MTLEQWDALCEREWEERHGDIWNLFLTEKSRRELEHDLIRNPRPDLILLYTKADLDEMKDKHHLFIYVKNRITCTQCRINDARLGRDQAEVRYLVDCCDIPGITQSGISGA